MLTARVDIIGHTSVTVDVQIMIFPNADLDPKIGSVSILDNSTPPQLLRGHAEYIPDCSSDFGIDPPFQILGIPLTRLPIKVQVTHCLTGAIQDLGTFLREMSPGGDVPCSNDVILPASQGCLDAQNQVGEARHNFLTECSNIADAKGRRDSSIAGAAAAGAIGIASAAASVTIVAAIIQAQLTIALAVAAGAATGAVSVPGYGWIAAVVLALIAIALIALLGLFLNNFMNAQNDISAAQQRQIANLQAFHQAVENVRTACCTQQISPMLNLETPTCP